MSMTVLDEPLLEYSSSKALRIDNKICAYCGASLTVRNTSRDHAIGRRFVPKGALNNSWNLILNCCQKCNGIKSDLENDISAITMMPNLDGEYRSDNPLLREEVSRKAAKAISRRTGKPVSVSQERIQIGGDLFPGIRLNFDAICQPQIDQERAFQLAWYHFAAFFFFVTYDHSKRSGYHWKGHWSPIQIVGRSDWGNELAVGFMRATNIWEPRFLGECAKGFFWIAIRKAPDADIWSLAVEWNKNYRVVAACGDTEKLKGFLDRLPKLAKKILVKDAKGYVAYREEVSLKEEDDSLFVWDDPIQRARN